MSRFTTSSAGLVLALCLVPAPALAASPAAGSPKASPAGGSPAPPACAAGDAACGKRVFAEGVTAYQAGDYATAIARFQAALEVKWHPAIALNLGLAEARAGRVVSAVRHLDEVIARPEASAAVRDQARRERAAAADRVATIVVDTSGDAAMSVQVDGATVDATAPVSVDPGEHRLDLRFASGANAQRTVTLAPRERLRLALDRTRELLVVPGAPSDRREPAAVAATTPASPPATADSRGGPSPVWFYVGAGATLVLAGATVWSGVDTLHARDDYRASLATASQAELDRMVDRGHGLETRTNVLLGVTAAAAVGTAVLGLFVVDFGGRGGAQVGLGPTFATLRAAF